MFNEPSLSLGKSLHRRLRVHRVSCERKELLRRRLRDTLKEKEETELPGSGDTAMVLTPAGGGVEFIGAGQHASSADRWNERLFD